MSINRLYDQPGPRGRRRQLMLEVVSALIVAAIVAVALIDLISHGVFDGAAWEPFSEGGVWKLIGQGLWNNVRAAIVAMILSVIVGAFLAFGLLAQSRLARLPSQVFSAVFNCVPVLLLLFFTSLMLPSWGLHLSSFWFLVIALTLYNGAVVGDLLKAGIRSIPHGQSEAAAALGFSPARTMRAILLPQAVRAMSPGLVSQLVIIFKGTALAYVLGDYLELLHTATVVGTFYSQSSLQALFIAAILFMSVNMALSFGAASVERREKKRYGLQGAPRGRVAARIGE